MVPMKRVALLARSSYPPPKQVMFSGGEKTIRSRTSYSSIRLFLYCFLILNPLTLFAQQQPPPLPGRVATLAFFLDSVDTIEPGVVWISNIFTYRKSPSGKELDVPALAVSYGLNRRLQVDFSIPYFRAEYGPDFQLNGMGDSFLSAKIRAIDSDSHPLGVAFEPVLEILGNASLAAGDQGPKKYNLALPIILQKNFSHLNFYGEAGYITRGAVFAGVAGDGALYQKLGLSVNILYSRATRFGELSQQYGLVRSRVDGIIGLYYVLAPRFSVFASGGRTLTAMDPISTSYIFNVGLNVNFNLRQLLVRER